MATPEEDITKEKEKQLGLSENLEEVEKRSVEDTGERLSYTRDITQELEDQLGIKSKLSLIDRSIKTLSNEVLKSARENNTQLRESGKLEARILNDKRIRASLLAEENLLENNLSEAQKLKAKEVAETNRARLDIENEIIKKAQELKYTDDAEKQKQIQEDINALVGTRASIEDKLFNLTKDVSPEEAKLGIVKQLIDAMDGMIASREKETEAQNKVNSALGLTGSLLDNVNKVGIRAFGGIGLNLAAFGVELRDAKLRADEMAESLALTKKGEGISQFEKRVRVMKEALPGIRKAFFSAFNDPLTMAVTLFSNIYQSALALNTSTVELARLNGDVNRQSMVYNTAMASAVDILKLAGELTVSLGFAAERVFSPSVLASAAEFKNMLGLSAQEAGGLALLSQVTEKTLDESGTAIVNQVNNFNRLNRSAVSQGVVLRDVAKASDGITASLGAQPGLIAAAAAAARRLGIELKELDSIANSLLDFESSIEAELEAQLLTGKQINLNKARELALSNDLAGLGEELFKNSADLAEFGTYNRIQQEGYAKAIGMTRDQLARTAYLRSLEVGMTQEQAAEAANVSLEEMKRLSIQESISKSVEKITQQLAAPLEIIAALASNSWVLYSALALIAGLGLAKVVITVASLAATLAAAGVGAITLGSALTAGLITAAVVGGIAAMVGAFSSAKKTMQVDDGVFDPEGGLLVSTPKGELQAQLNKNDRLFAGTKLGEGIPENSSINITGGSERLAQQTLQETRRLVSLMEALNNKNTNIMLDGNKVNVGLALSDSKNA